MLSGMIKRLPAGDSLRRRLEENALDRVYQFLLDYGTVRGALVHGTRLVREMRVNHELDALESLVLGQAYVAAALLSVNLKGFDRLKLQVHCDGPLKGFSVEANAFGEVRGYLLATPLSPPGPVDPADLSALYGEGVLSVTRYLEEARRPFSGQVSLVHGNLAQDLAHYFLASEQTASSVHLSVRFDGTGEIVGAGGLFLQAMPGAELRVVERIDELARELPSIGASFAEGQPAEELLAEWFAPFSPLVLGSRRVAFMCHCSARRFGRFLGALPRAELQDMLEKGPFPVVTTCWNCNTQYAFPREEIERMLRESALSEERSQGGEA
jgi:molecular chaperone Hsp33